MSAWSWWVAWVDRHIEDESQVSQQFENIPRPAATAWLAAVWLTAYSAWHAAPAYSLVWLGAVSGMAVAWLLLKRALSGQQPQPRAALPRWAALHTLMVAGMGSLWGLSIAVFDVPQNFNQGIATVTAQALVAMLGWLAFSGFFPTLLWFAHGVFAPTAAAYLVQGDVAHTVLCVALHVIFVLQGRKVIEVVRIRHEKEALVEQLQQENRAKQLALAQAEEATAAKMRFFSAVSHDVRQPLYSLSLLADTFNRSQDAVRRNELAQQMQHSVGMLDDLFTQLLQLSRLEAPSEPAPLQAVDVHDLVEQTASVFALHAREHGVPFEWQACKAWVWADRFWLQRILLNLLSNAIHHAAGSSIVLHAQCSSSEVMFSVKDRGPGIEQDQQEKIFEEFYRSAARRATASMSKRNFGLGLPIAQRLARAMNGRIQVQSTQGDGSCFWLCLPIAEPPQPSIHATGSAGLLGGVCVGIVEDDASTGEALVGLLQSWGMKPLWARSADQALAWPEALTLLLVGYELALDHHALSGVQIARALRERWQCQHGGPVSVLVTSGLDLGVEHTQGLDTLRKPVAPIKLRAWLLQALALQQRGEVTNQHQDRTKVQ